MAIVKIVLRSKITFLVKFDINSKRCDKQNQNLIKPKPNNRGNYVRA